MAYTKEKKYLVSGYYGPEAVDVLVGESQVVELWSNEGDDEYIKPGLKDRFFDSLEKAYLYLDSIIPKNKDRIKEYLKYLYDCDDFESLEEILPQHLYKDFRKGRTCFKTLDRFQWEKIREALGGRLIINAHSIRPSDVVTVTSLADNRRELVLSNGEKIVSTDDIECRIIDSVFRHYTSGTYINR